MKGNGREVMGAVLVVLAIHALANTAAAGSSIGYVSQQGDYIGQGQTKSYTEADGTFTSTTGTDNGAHIAFDHSTNFSIWWHVDLEAPHSDRLAVGSYPGATRYGFQDPAVPGLDFSGSGRGCNQLSGSFAISEILYDWFGNVVRLGATLTQHCENQTPALFGNVNYEFGTVGPMTVGQQNVLVSWRNRVQEFTRAGALVKTVPILGGTEKPSNSEVSRDLIRDSAGRLHVYTGTFSPVLDSLVPASGAWTQSTQNDWSTANSLTYGGIAAFGPWVFVSDMTSAGDPTVGIVRFDATHVAPTVQFAETQAYIDLASGLDGKLYGLRSDGQHVDAFDPVTLASAGGVVLATSVDAIAVDAASQIFAVTYNTIYRFDGSGAIADSHSPSVLWLGDIDVSPSGAIVIGTSDSHVVLTTTALDTSTSFSVGTPAFEMTFVAFGEEPADLNPIFRDGFDSADLDLWSAHVP